LKREIFVLGLTFCIVFSPLAFGAEWYETVTTKRNAPFNLTLFHAFGSGNKRLMGTFHLDGKPSRGKMYIILSRSELRKIEAAGERNYVHHKKVLNRNEAAFWKKFLAERAEVKRVPLLISIAAIGAGFVNAPVGVVASVTATFMDVVLSVSDVKTVTASALSELMASGGKFIEYITIRRDGARASTLLFYLFLCLCSQSSVRAY